MLRGSALQGTVATVESTGITLRLDGASDTGTVAIPYPLIEDVHVSLGELSAGQRSRRGLQMALAGAAAAGGAWGLATAYRVHAENVDRRAENERLGFEANSMKDPWSEGLKRAAPIAAVAGTAGFVIGRWPSEHWQRLPVPAPAAGVDPRTGAAVLSLRWRL